MSRDLYADPIVALARREIAQGRLAHPRASVTLDNPLCGDRVTMDVDWRDDGTITRLGCLVRGCLLCRASASVLGARAAGRLIGEIETAMRQLERMLAHPGVGSPEDWPDLAPFAAVHGHSSRYDCVLLPFHTLLVGLGVQEP